MNGHRPKYKSSKDLPIYRAAMLMLEVVDDIHDDFRRDRRHTIWQQLCNDAGRLPYLVCVANDFPDRRRDALMDILATVAVMQSKMSLCAARGYIPMNRYLACARPFSSIERQANGWLNKTNDSQSSGLEPEECSSI